MSEKPNSGDSNLDEPKSEDSNGDEPTSDNSHTDERNDNDESVEPISEEEGFKSVEKMFKAQGSKAEDSGSDEDREFVQYLKHLKRAKDLGIFEHLSTTIYQGGIHIKDSHVDNSGNFVGNDQTTNSGVNTGEFSRGEENKSSDKQEKIESIESVFDRCNDIKQRSFMIALAALNGCNYRIVAEASQKLQFILQSQAEAGGKA